MQETQISTEALLSELQQNITGLDRAAIEEICASVLVGEPENETAHRLLFDASKRAGDLEGAEKALVNWITSCDGFVPRFEYGRLLSVNGREHEAIEQFQFALRESKGTEPELFEIFKGMGNCFVKTQDYQGAEELYNRAYAINSQSDVLEINYGTLYIQMNRFHEASERFKNAIQINGTNEKAWLGLALSFRGLMENELAYANLLSALEIKPDSAIATQTLFDWSFQDNRFDELTRKLEEKFAAGGKAMSEAILLARVFIYQQHWVPAFELLEDCQRNQASRVGTATELDEVDRLLKLCKSKMSQV